MVLKCTNYSKQIYQFDNYNEIDLEPNNGKRCLADILYILDNINDNEIIGPNHAFFLKQMFVKHYINKETIVEISKEFGFEQKTFIRQMKLFKNYIIDKLKDENLY